MKTSRGHDIAVRILQEQLQRGGVDHATKPLSPTAKEQLRAATRLLELEQELEDLAADDNEE